MVETWPRTIEFTSFSRDEGSGFVFFIVGSVRLGLKIGNLSTKRGISDDNCFRLMPLGCY